MCTAAQAASVSAQVWLTYSLDRRFFNWLALAANKSYVMRVELFHLMPGPETFTCRGRLD